MSKYLSTCLILATLCAFASQLSARDRVLVGLAHFPPYIENHNDQVGGIAGEMLRLFNAHQDRYEFIGIPTLAETRHEAFRLGRYDMSMFDNLDWGWKGLKVDASNVFLSGGEVFITQAKPGRDQSYFDSIENKQLVGVKGYHYAFANYNSNPDFLRRNFNMQLSKSNLGSIQLILSGQRGDIAVVTKSFLARYLNQHPDNKTNLLVSLKMDQVYQHRIIIRKEVKPSIDEINLLIDQLNANGKLPALFESINSD